MNFEIWRVSGCCCNVFWAEEALKLLLQCLNETCQLAVRGIWGLAASACVNDEWAASRGAEEEEAGGHSLPDKLLHNAG